jgi:hypothetical protein
VKTLKRWGGSEQLFSLTSLKGFGGLIILKVPRYTANLATLPELINPFDLAWGAASLGSIDLSPSSVVISPSGLSSDGGYVASPLAI